jgi:hypothetical protein
MTTDHDVDRITAAFLRDGPTQLADRVLEAALDDVNQTRQRRRPSAPWRNLRMSTFRIAAVVAVLVVGGLAIVALGRGPSIASPARPNPSIAIPSVAATAVPATPVAPSPSARADLLAPLGYAGTGTIAFTRNDPALGGWAPFLVDPAGTNEARIGIEHGWAAGSVPGTGCCGVFSPDGTKVAVGFDEQNPSRGPGTLAGTQVFGLDGTSESLVPMACGGCAAIVGVDFVPRAWSAGTNLLALDVVSSSDPTRAGIALVPMDGGAHSPAWESQVTGQPDDRPLAFSPDGTRLLFVRHQPDAALGELFELTIATKAIRRVSRAGELVYADDYLGPGASWSPDGSRIAFAATDATGDSTRMRVFVAAADGGTPTPITSVSSFSTVAAWSPDGAWIAFDRDMGGGTHHVFVVAPDGTRIRDLMQGASFGGCCGHWSPDGSSIVAPATTGQDDESDLVVLPIDGSGIRQVTTVPSYYTSISWSPASR